MLSFKIMAVNRRWLRFLFLLLLHGAPAKTHSIEDLEDLLVDGIDLLLLHLFLVSKDGLVHPERCVH